MVGLDVCDDHPPDLREPRAGGGEQHDQPSAILIDRERGDDHSADLIIGRI